MTDSPVRAVTLWQPDVGWERRDDGAWLVWQNGELGAYPDRMSDMVLHWAAQTPDTPWMAERGPDGAWRRVTYGALLGHVRAIGQALLDLNLSTDRPLVILSGNSIAHALMALGAQHVGIPSAAIAPAYSLVSSGYEKLQSVRDQITPGAVFVDDTGPFANAIKSVFPDLPVLAPNGDGVAMPWETLLATVPTGAVDAAYRATGPETVAKFLFTSGTTGSPKAVIQTQRMLCANIEQVTDCYAYLREEPPIILEWAPWNHVAAGNLCFNLPLYLGGTYHIDAGRPTPDLMHKTLENLRDVRPNWYFNVPFGFEMLVEAMDRDPTLAEAYFANLKFMNYAGAAMAQHTWEALERLAVRTTGERVVLSTGLGATETAPFALSNSTPVATPGNLGVPARGVLLKLLPNDGKWEARFKGPNVTPGYWRNDALTAEAFDDEGFYRMGDALRFADPEDPSKGFIFDGRVAENFKLATGTWVGVGALRAKLIDALVGLVRDAVIVGENRDSLGALLVPFRPAIEKLVPGGADLDDRQLFSHPDLHAELQQRLTAYNVTATGSSLRVPRALVLLEPLSLDRGEVTDKGSVNQRAVRAHRADLVDRLYAGDPRMIDCASD